MKGFRIGSVSICIIILIILGAAIAAQAREARIIGADTVDILAITSATAGDIQADTTLTLEGTSWDVTMVTYSILQGGIQASTAEMIFSAGELTISDWIMILQPGAYTETPKAKFVSFTATLERRFPRQTFQVQGSAVPNQGIVGVLVNGPSRIPYFFYGVPTPPE